MHKLQMYENLRDMLEQEVKDIEKKGDLDVQGLDNLYKLMTALKVTDRCIDREKGEQNGMSRNSYDNSYGYGSTRGVSNTYDMSRDYSRDNSMGMMPHYAMDGRRGRDGDSDGRYNESRDNFRDNSNRRGSYESYDGRSYEYSRDNSRKKMIQKLETLMDDTMSESERRAIMECIEKIK